MKRKTPKICANIILVSLLAIGLISLTGCATQRVKVMPRKPDYPRQKQAEMPDRTPSKRPPKIMVIT
jgi:hypothetical protein